MANTRISQLPVYTGSAADIRWFVMNNSGETTTYKYSGYTSPFVVENYAQASIFSTFGTPAVYDADCVGSVIIGSEAVGYDDYTTLVGWKAIGNNDIEGRCSAYGADAQATGRFSTALGMSSRAAAGNTTAVGHNATASADGAVSLGHTAYATGQNTICIGKGLTNSSPEAVLIGGRSNTIPAANDLSVVIGGRNHTSNNQYATILGGAANTAGYLSVALGGFGLNVSNQSSAINGENNTASAAYGGIFGGTNNTASGNYSTIIGGLNSNTNNQTRAIMLGTSGRTANADNTTYTENLHIYRTPSTQVQPISSGTTFTCNLENGAKSQFYITGTSTINITNVRDGASFSIKTQTTGNYVMTWTATGGYTFLFEGGIKDPGNNVIDIFQFEVFGNVIYGSRKHNFS
jgi:hypothetical protein